MAASIDGFSKLFFKALAIDQTPVLTDYGEGKGPFRNDTIAPAIKCCDSDDRDAWNNARGVENA